jgi:hypothetical protein
MPESHGDNEGGKLNIFHSIKDGIQDEIDHKLLDSSNKIPEDPEILISPWENDEKSKEDLFFENDKINFLFKLYDQRRAAGIKPAMGFKFKPNVDIFDADSDHPFEDLEILKPHVNVPREAMEFGDINYEEWDKSVSDSLFTNEGSSSLDPDSEEIEEFERMAREGKEEKERQKIWTEDLLTKYAKIFKRDKLNPGKPEHNIEVIEYEGQVDRELYSDNSPTNKRTTILKKKLLTKGNKKFPKFVKRVEISLPNTMRGKEENPVRSRNPKESDIETLKKRQPELFERIDLNEDNEKLSPRFKKDYEVPVTPTSSPVNRMIPVKAKVHVDKLSPPKSLTVFKEDQEDPYLLSKIKNTTNKVWPEKVKKEYLKEAIALRGDVDPFIYEDSESSE